jgi:hypothetical protein
VPTICTTLAVGIDGVVVVVREVVVNGVVEVPVVVAVVLDDALVLVEIPVVLDNVIDVLVVIGAVVLAAMQVDAAFVPHCWFDGHALQVFWLL